MVEDPLRFTKKELEEMNLVIILENYRRKDRGIVKRKYWDSFSDAERRVISGFMPKIKLWTNVVGYPEFYKFKAHESIGILKRAVRFFANV